MPLSPIVRALCTTALAFLILLSVISGAHAQIPGQSTLGELMMPRGGKILHFSSTDPRGGNDDFRPIAPGQTYTLLDYKGGAGIIRRWWVTLAPRNNVAIQRQAIVRCYWDGEESPSVEVPVSDFFGMGFGEWRDYQSLPLNMTSGGYNCYWPMPFHHSARITIENRSNVRIDALYYNIDVETHKSLSNKALYFHAQFRRSNPTPANKPYVLLETTGKGQYVGSLISMQNLHGHSFVFLEGDEQVTVDGEKTPSILGTGTEDYFSSGWYFDTGVYSAPYHGVTIKDSEKGRICAYRWHIEDAIPFEKSIRFAIEHGPVNDVEADYSSVAFYYQTHPHAPFPPLPTDLLPTEPTPIPHIPGMIEGESLIGTAQASDGIEAPQAASRFPGLLDAQDMSPWTGAWSGAEQLWWHPKAPGARLILTIKAPATKEYELIGYFTQAKDYGDIRFRVNGGDPLPVTVPGYSEEVRPTGLISLGRVTLTSGINHLEVEITGKDARSTGYLVGIDGFVLKP